MDKGKKVDYISISEVVMIYSEKINKLDKKGKQSYLLECCSSLKDIKPVFEKILSKGTRILDSAGNNLKILPQLIQID